MGLFSTTKKVYVSSVAYNMAGPVEDRPNFLKTIMVESVLSNSPSIADDIVSSHLHGPGIDQRAFYRWARTEYPEGKCQGRVSQDREVSKAVVEAEIPPPAGGSVDVKAAFIGMGDITYWGERWLLDNDPAAYEDPWVAEFDAGPKELVLSFPSDPEVRVHYPGFSSRAKYIYAYYERTDSMSVVTPRVYIYKIGNGNVALDGLDREVELKPEIFPVIPLRLDNKPIDHADFAADFEQHAKAFKKSVGSDISEVLATIEDNPDVGDIDHAFVVHGVELNTVEKEGKRYLYEFFREMIPSQKTSPLELSNWITSALGYGGEKAALNAWKAAQDDPLHPLYGTTRPTVPIRAELEVTRFEVKTVGALRYETHLGWVTIQEDVAAGLGKPGAKRGQLWFEVESDITIPGVPFDVDDEEGEAVTGSLSRFRLYWQEETAVYRFLTIYGMFHENFVYDGKTVEISATEALTDPDESGFVVPLHYPTLTALSLTGSTQMSISNRLLVFNCYEVVKTRWYEKAVFRFVFAIILAALVAVAFPAAIGVLGSNAVVGGWFGLAGPAALIAGGVANAIAAMVIVTIIETGAVALFGEEVGGIIGTIASAIAIAYVGSYMNGTGGFSMNISEMIKAENILKMTNAVSGSVEKWATSKMGEIQDTMIDDYDQYKDDEQEIENKRLEIFGYGQGVINPLMFLQMDGTSSPETIGVMEPESSSTFLTRTLLTGSDIAEMSIALVRNYPALALELPEPMN